MKNKIILFSKALGGILVAFFVSTFLIKNVFLANSPRINGEFITKLKQTPNLIAGLPGKIFNSFTKNSTTKTEIASNIQEQPITEEEANEVTASLKSITPPSDAVFKSISTGVSAAERDNDQVILKIEAGTQYKVRRFKLPDGQTVDIIDLSGSQ